MAGEITAKHVDEAIAVRRGQRRLRDVPAADRALVEQVLRRTSDARLAQTIEASHRPRERAFRFARPRYNSLRRE